MRVIVLGDLHYTEYDDPQVKAARERFFEGFFRQVAAHQADVVVAIGDTTDGGTIAELIGQDAVFQRAGLDVVRVPGNHDAASVEKPEIASYFLGGRTSASATELYTSFDAGPVRFVLLDTTRSKDENWSGFVSAEQQAWLETQIETFNRSSEPRHLIVMGHHPIMNTTRMSELKWFNIDNSQDVRPIFNKLTRTPGVYVNGHNHVNSVVGPDENGWCFVQPGAPMVCRSYGLFTIDETGIRYETVDIDLSDLQMLADLDAIRYIMGGFNEIPLEEIYGTNADRLLEV